MTDNRREFLLRFAATALAAAGAGCDTVSETKDEPLARRDGALAVYGPPARSWWEDQPRVVEIFFRDGELQPDDAARAILDGVVKMMMQGTSLSAIIEGHADDRGTREYNLSVGERRAQAVRQYLRGQGVEDGRLEAISLGRERPRNLARTKEAQAVNRRVVIRLDLR